MVGSGKPTRSGAGVWRRPRTVNQVFERVEDRRIPTRPIKIRPMVPTRCLSDRCTASRIGISDPKLATLVSVSDRNARREPAAGVAPFQIPRSPTHPASGRASSYPKAPVARGPYDRRESRPLIRGSHTRTDAPHGRQSSKFFNQPVPEVRRPVLSPDSGCQWRLEPPPKSIRRPAGPGSRPRRIQTLSDSGLADPTEPAGHTLPGRFKAARRRGVSPGRLSLRRTRVAATIHHPAAQAAGGNRRSPERTEKSYPPGLKASICEAPGVRGRTPGALGRPNSPARIARTRGAHWPPLISLRSPAPHQSIRTPTPNTPTRNKPTRSSNQSKRCNWLLESRPEPGPFSVARTTTRSDTRPSLPRLQRVATRCEFGNFAQSAPSTNTPRTHASVRPRGGDEPAFHHRLTRGPRDRPAW